MNWIDELMIAGRRNDYAYQNIISAKLQNAINFLGERYCFHPANQVKRLAEPLPDNKVDVTKTWAKFK